MRRISIERMHSLIPNVSSRFAIKLKHSSFTYKGLGFLGVGFRINSEIMTPLHIWQGNFGDRSITIPLPTENKNNTK
jgi:hypothetical protein